MARTSLDMHRPTDKADTHLDASSSRQHSLSAIEEDAKDTEKPESDTNGQDSPEKSPEAPEEWISGVPLFMVIAGITLVIFLMLLDVSIVSTAVPKITNQFHSLEDVAWYGSAYTLASCALQPLTGKFYTHFKSKPKWVFISFLALFEVGSLICGVANSSKTLIVGRAIAGMGSSGLINGALTILAGAVPMHKRPALIGFMMGVSQLGLVLGPLVGGALTTYTTWRWCFYINLPIGGLVSILLVATRVPEQRKKGRALDILPTFHKTFDLLGFALFAPAAIMLLLALEYGGNEYPWDDSRVIGLFVGAGVTAIVFLCWEYYKGKDAMIPFHLFTVRIAYASYGAVCAMFGLTMILSYYLPIYFQAVTDDSALTSGVKLLPNILSQMVASIVAGVSTPVQKIGFYTPFSLVGSALTAIGGGLMSMLTPTTSTAAWAGYQVLMGLGRGMATQAPMLAVQHGINPDDISTAMAILTFFQTFGGSVFLALGSVIFSQGLKSQIPRFAPAVDPNDVVAAGATGFRDIIAPGEDLQGVLKAYARSIGWVFYLVAALAVAQWAFSWGLGFVDVRKKEGSKKEDERKVKDEEKGDA
ncbi:major facilitator superfamily domain-containing protein [Aspergillus unguis]